MTANPPTALLAAPIRHHERVPVPDDWGTIFGDTVVAAAVLDRLMHNAIVFNIKGPSWRLREHNSLEIATTNPTERRPS